MTSKPIGKIVPDDWMTGPEAGAVMDALTATGLEARFVGGCVRDAVIKRPVRDIDIATPLEPQTVIPLLEERAIRVIPTGIDHGTVTAIVDAGKGPKSFEITTLRRDVESHGRHATVAFTDDWVEDAKRRDFTINTLSCDRNGNVYDPFSGLDDLGAGRVRFVGIARERIEEDVLRLLRFFRFYAYYGKPPADKDALVACRLMVSKLDGLSGERVQSELLRILLAETPADIVLLMQGEHVLEHILPEAVSAVGGETESPANHTANNVGRLRQMAWLEAQGLGRDDVTPDAIRRLAALLDTDAVGAEDVARRLRLSNVARERLITMTNPQTLMTPELGEPARHHWFNKLGSETVRDLALLAWAGERADHAKPDSTRTKTWSALLDEADAWVMRDFPLKGRDAMALNIKPGPDMGRLLDAVENWWEGENFQPDRDACLAKLKTLIDAD